MVAGLEQAGAPPEIIESARKRRVNTAEFEVWEENWESLLLFLGMGTQWQVCAGMAGVMYIGIPAQSIEAEMNMQCIGKKQRPALLADIRIMERAALPILNKPRD